jgi:DNA-binding SARP family transcriptional activator/tetratricopeptide (TPR) repeat protein
MDVRLLGPVEVWTAGGLVDAGPPRQRCLLAALAVDAGRPVMTDVLVDRVWGDAPPSGGRHALHVHIARLRKALPEGGRLVHRSGGYLLDLEPESTDVHRFRRLVDRAQECADPEAAALLRTALQLWRGEPLAGLGGVWVDRVRDAWHRRRLDAVVAWSQVQLRLGNAGAVVTLAQDLSAEYPLAEPLAAVLISGLARAGRGAEALERYAETRRRLLDELGAEPGPQLQRLHTALLRGDLDRPVPARSPASAEPLPARATPSRPAQLPPDLPGLTGRGHELSQLDGFLDKAGGEGPSVVISALSGTAGVGKTALAVHWAHRVADRFPDGQLYINLRGFAADVAAIPPEEALRTFLDALGVPADGVPPGLGARSALYRSLLSGRRVLVVLDNARDAAQVRPLLPGSPGCAVVVTSRSQLPGLVAAEGAHPLTVHLLSALDARALLRRRVGAARVAAEPAAVDEIVERCARLPLALAIVAARAATSPGLPLSALAAELRDARGDLDAFDGGDATTQVRAVFSWSYHALVPSAARLFRLLGLHPGPDISAAAAASLAGGAPPGASARDLQALARAHLVSEHLPGRYALHDLLRAYAAALAAESEPEDERGRALRRLYDHYLETAHRADRLLDPHRDGSALAPSEPGVVPEPLPGPTRALEWFTAEHDVLMSALAQADDAHAWRLAWCMTTYFHRSGHWHDWAAAQSAALAAAQRLGDDHVRAGAHRDRALAYSRLGRFADAHADLRNALELYEKLDDPVGLAHAQMNLAETLTRQGRHQEALAPSRQALMAFRDARHLAGQASALHGIGWNYAQLGDDVQALAYCQQALALHQQLGDLPRAAAAWDSLGYAHLRLGNHALAVDCYERALDVHRRGNHRYCQAGVLLHLGDVHAAAGDRPAARAAWLSAVRILDDLGHAEAAEVRARLANY